MKTRPIPRTELADACRQFGKQVGPLPASVDGTRLLWALAGVESSFGQNLTPRHEPAYDTGGKYSTHAPMPYLLGRFGSDAACSYGPLQVMLCNASGLTPSDFDLPKSALQASVIFLNSKLRQWHPQSLAEIGECWNRGNLGPDPDYVLKLGKAYLEPLPDNGGTLAGISASGAVPGLPGPFSRNELIFLVCVAVCFMVLTIWAVRLDVASLVLLFGLATIITAAPPINYVVGRLRRR